jgi:hypothetical protein
LIFSHLSVSSVRTKQISMHSPFLMVSSLTVSNLGHRRIWFVHEFSLTQKIIARELR